MRLERSLPLLGLLLCADRNIGVFPLASFLVGLPSQEEFLVEISGTTVTVTCPLPEPVIWDVRGAVGDKEGTKFIIKDHDSTPANLSCTSTSPSVTRQLYLSARVCANCEELDALTVAGIITADLLITLGVLILVYYFSKGRKGRASAGRDSRPRGQKMQRPPPVPNPDYEPIRKGQREVYAGLESRGL
ncbi:CD3E protein, partial [Ptilonorhynchus violaceus]|nr:CD3E protein [Ptilonorhynchus violaceus]